MDLQATIEFAIELYKFHNVDLFQRGIYQVRCQLKVAPRIPVQIETYMANPAPTVSGNCGASKVFQILYRNEEVLLKDVIMFRAHLLVDSRNLKESIERAEFSLNVELWFADQATGQDLCCVSSRLLSLNFHPVSGLHYHLPVLFDYFHLSAVSIQINASLVVISTNYISHKSMKSWIATSKFNFKTASSQNGLEALFFGSQIGNVVKCTGNGNSSRLNVAKAIHREICELLLGSLRSLKMTVDEFNAAINLKLKPSFRSTNYEQRLKNLAEYAENGGDFGESNDFDGFASRANSNIAKLCAECVSLWRKVVSISLDSPIVKGLLAKKHHTLRVKRFSEGFFVMNNAASELIASTYEINHQKYLEICEMARKSKYLSTLPMLPVHCNLLDGDTSSLPLIFEEHYSGTKSSLTPRWERPTNLALNPFSPSTNSVPKICSCESFEPVTRPPRIDLNNTPRLALGRDVLQASLSIIPAAADIEASGLHFHQPCCPSQSLRHMLHHTNGDRNFKYRRHKSVDQLEQNCSRPLQLEIKSKNCKNCSLDYRRAPEDRITILAEGCDDLLRDLKKFQTCQKPACSSTLPLTNHHRSDAGRLSGTQQVLKMCNRSGKLQISHEWRPNYGSLPPKSRSSHNLEKQALHSSLKVHRKASSRSSRLVDTEPSLQGSSSESEDASSVRSKRQVRHKKKRNIYNSSSVPFLSGIDPDGVSESMPNLVVARRLSGSRTLRKRKARQRANKKENSSSEGSGEISSDEKNKSREKVDKENKEKPKTEPKSVSDFNLNGTTAVNGTLEDLCLVPPPQFRDALPPEQFRDDFTPISAPPPETKTPITVPSEPRIEAVDNPIYYDVTRDPPKPHVEASVMKRSMSGHEIAKRTPPVFQRKASQPPPVLNGPDCIYDRDSVAEEKHPERSGGGGGAVTNPDHMLEFEKCREEFRKMINYPGCIYSDRSQTPASDMPYFHISDELRILSPNGLHLIICVHGLDGNSADLRLFRNYLELGQCGANLDFLMSQQNQGDTFSDFDTMTDRLVSEILYHIEARQINPCRISFIAHSLGTILVRNVLTRKEMKHLLPRLHTFLSLSGPHLGTLYGSNIINMGMWFMQKWKKSASLLQLCLKDATDDLRQSFLYKLSLSNSLNYFRNILLFNSLNDRYVPPHSARLELCKAAIRDQSSLGVIYREMHSNILSKLAAKTDIHLARFDVYHALPRTNASAFIGRAAHIAVLDSDLFIQKFLLISGVKYFS